MAETNPYKILGLSDNASKDDATTAYRKLAKKYHPDLNPGDEKAAKKMAEINAAYDAIMNDEPYGPKARQNPYTGYPPQNPYAGGYVDPFEEMFRQAQKQSQQASAQGQTQQTYRRTTVSPANGCMRVIIVIMAINILFSLFFGRGCFSAFTQKQKSSQTIPYSQSQPYYDDSKSDSDSNSSNSYNDSSNDSNNNSNFSNVESIKYNYRCCNDA